MQAIYHGKPVVAMPFFGDQLNNADKMVSKVGTANSYFKEMLLRTFLTSLSLSQVEGSQLSVCQ